ncbi:MAG: hypothetical protein VKL39_09920 [Leptolyngbyaceae bacterium]|nr:hypothetical protein [Leptolyngbyaceae bacterium]
MSQNGKTLNDDSKPSFLKAVIQGSARLKGRSPSKLNSGVGGGALLSQEKAIAPLRTVQKSGRSKQRVKRQNAES